MTTKGGCIYEGTYNQGRRHGQGRIEYPCGLSYDGDWKDGQPHGQGKMTSTSSRFTYEGDFEKGSIKGTGT